MSKGLVMLRQTFGHFLFECLESSLLFHKIAFIFQAMNVT